MILSIILIVVGFISLIFGANWLVEGASSLAKRFGISDLAIGLTVVAFGTSAPELVVNVIASTQGLPDIILGNIIGSNNFNLFIILGIAGLIYPIAVQSSTAWKEIPISLCIAVLLLILCNDFFMHENTQLHRWEGGLLLIIFFAFLYYVFTQMKQEPEIDLGAKLLTLKRTWVYIVLGLGGLILGGQLVVTHSVQVATDLGVSEKLIGLTIVAAGTSLPELVTSVIAAIKKNSDIAIGNVIGSNIFNIIFILAISSLIEPISYNAKFDIDIIILISGTIFLLLAMLTGMKKKLDRWEAGLLVAFYVGYTMYVIMYMD